MNKWFILSQGQVTGPYNDDQVPEEAVKHSNCLVWTRGELEWVPYEKWDYLQSQSEQRKKNLISSAPIDNENFSTKTIASPRLQTIPQNSQFTDKYENEPTSSPLSETTHTHIEMEKTRSHTLTQVFPESDWKIRIGDEEFKELSYLDLLDKTKNLTDFTNVKIYDRKVKQWRDIYSFEKIINDLGISRRKHDRVPILGTFVGECERIGSVQGRVVSVSEGGFGLSEGKKYQINDQLRGVISSPNLILQIHCTAEVVYLSPEGVAGLKFKTIPEDAHASLIEYINKFNSVRNRKS